MKKFNSQSVSRQVKRNKVRFFTSEFIKNEYGTPKIFKERNTQKVKWVLA